MIVVFDSGIWVSALRFGSVPLTALDHAFTHCEVAICRPIMLEIKDVLPRKFGWGGGRITQSVARYFSPMIHVEITGQLRGICRDPKDDMVLECATLASADLIVTGDRDLLILNSYQNIQIITPGNISMPTPDRH